MIDIRLVLMTGSPIPIPECQLTMTPPTIYEIGMFGENNFFEAIHFLTINGNEFIEQNNLDMDIQSNFNFLLTLFSNNQNTKQKNLVLDFLKLCFPNYKVMWLPRALMFNLGQDSVIIDENNFDVFQDYLKQIFYLSQNEGQDYNPANDAAAEIAKKLMRGRQRVAAQKRNAEGNTSTLAQYVSILCIALKKEPKEISSLTLYQLYDLMERWNLYEQYDIGIRVRLVGGGEGEELEEWKKPLH